MYAVAIDFGKKICGLAKADLSSPVKLALPWTNVQTEELLDFLLRQKDEIKFLVLGKSLSLSGKENDLQIFINELAKKLKHHGFKVYFEDERFSTQATKALQRLQKAKIKSRKAKKDTRKDAHAASFILQSFLDKNQDNLL